MADFTDEDLSRMLLTLAERMTEDEGILPEVCAAIRFGFYKDPRPVNLMPFLTPSAPIKIKQAALQGVFEQLRVSPNTVDHVLLGELAAHVLDYPEYKTDDPAHTAIRSVALEVVIAARVPRVRDIIAGTRLRSWRFVHRKIAELRSSWHPGFGRYLVGIEQLVDEVEKLSNE